MRYDILFSNDFWDICVTPKNKKVGIFITRKDDIRLSFLYREILLSKFDKILNQYKKLVYQLTVLEENNVLKMGSIIEDFRLGFITALIKPNLHYTAPSKEMFGRRIRLSVHGVIGKYIDIKYKNREKTLRIFFGYSTRSFIKFKKDVHTLYIKFVNEQYKNIEQKSQAEIFLQQKKQQLALQEISKTSLDVNQSIEILDALSKKELNNIPEQINQSIKNYRE